MTLLSQYYRYKGNIFTECSLPYEGWLFVENSKSQKIDFSWVFTERVTYIKVITQQWCTKLIKSDKYGYNVTKDFYFI